MRELFVTRAAEADLLESWSYLFEKSTGAAEKILDEITDQFDVLCEFPFIGRRREEFGSTYRSFPVAGHVIYYRVSDTKIEISRVLHGSRDYTGLFSSDLEM